jgi:hypothetical protein
MNFIWILVLSPWVGFIVLILYDATKGDSDGGAIAVAAKNFKAFIERTTLMARMLWKAQSSTVSQASSPTVAHGSSSSEPIRQPSLVEQMPAAAPKKKSRRKDGRVLATIPDLELAITEAVKQAAPECETFVGVVLQKMKPRSRRDANWQLRGIKFGQADRKIASEALAGTIERMQRGFYIGERG